MALFLEREIGSYCFFGFDHRFNLVRGISDFSFLPIVVVGERTVVLLQIQGQLPLNQLTIGNR
jgi:hypothetical protein